MPIPLSLPLALALLFAPPSDATRAPKHLAHLRPVIAGIAVSLELLDPRERQYVLAKPEDFASDLSMVRRRRVELADAPPLHDALMFPDRLVLNELLTFNRAYRQHLDGLAGIELLHWWEIREGIQETDRLYHVIDTARDALCTYYHVSVRRQALAKLRDQLGHADYYAACLPPAVPLWRFQSMR